MKKALKIQLIGKNEKVKENIIKKILGWEFLNLEYEYCKPNQFEAKLVEIVNGKECKFKLYTAINQFHFNNILLLGTPKRPDSSYIAFDLSNQESWDQIKAYIGNIPEIAKKVEDYPIVLAGNLSTGQDRKVDQQDIDNFVKKCGFYYFKISTDTGENIKESFQFLYQKLIELHP